MLRYLVTRWLALSLSLFVVPALAETFTLGGFSVALLPNNPTVNQLITAEITGSGCGAYTQLNAIEIDEEQGVIELSVVNYITGFLCPPKTPAEFEIGPLPKAQTYQVNLYEEDPPEDEFENVTFFNSSALVDSFDLTVLPGGTERYWPETPQAGSTQGGVGLIRGWACDASVIEVQFDELPRLPIGYGTSRTDTISRCGDDDNGYGAVFAWGTLGQGTHRMRTYIDDVLVADTEFEVAGFEDPFIQGLEGTYQLNDFPQPGESVVVRWSEADQNFIIIEHIK